MHDVKELVQNAEHYIANFQFSPGMICGIMMGQGVSHSTIAEVMLSPEMQFQAQTQYDILIEEGHHQSYAFKLMTASGWYQLNISNLTLN